MRQQPSLPALIADLQGIRRRTKLTQVMLAAKAKISVPTLRQAECGQGNLATLITLADALGVEISGRSMPPGDSLGERLAVLRKRRGMGRRLLAELAGVSPTTLATVEHGGTCHLASMLRIATALGAHLQLVPKGTPATYWTNAAASSVHDGWTTPSDVLERLYQVNGGRFDLDPCSPARRGPHATVQARVRYIAEDDALTLPWRTGSVFMNPPYGRTLPSWVAKAKDEVHSGRARVVFGLIPARTDTRWWHNHVAAHADVWMLKGRLSFGKGDQPAPFASAIVIWGAREEHRLRMAQVFQNSWHVPLQVADTLAAIDMAAD